MRPEEKAQTSHLKALTHTGERKFAITGTSVQCTHCGAVVGMVHNSRNLQAGHIILVRRTAVRCSTCLERSTWTPLDHTIPDVGRQ